jgi:glutamate dehydrogenase (NADP+)
MLSTRGDSLKGKIVSISGSGNVAQYATEKVVELGGTVVTASDSNGFIYDPKGIDSDKLKFIMDLKNVRRGRIKEYAEKYGVEYFEGKRPWMIKCDIAMPCATQNEINGEEARLLVKNGCKCVSEGSNMPSTIEAVEVFLNAQILYGPGKAANAGGVATSGLEMTQNSMRLPWSREEVDEKLHTIMRNIHKTCVKYGTKEDGFINYVDGANIGGFVKVANAMIAQGVV